MEERHRDDGFEVTFVVSVPRSTAWRRLRDATPASDRLPPPAPGQWWIPGVEDAGDEIEVVDGERLHVRKAHMPCQGTEIVVTMEDDATGTRITFVQSGFGPGFEEHRPWLEAGWWPIRADVHLYFERGVSAGRHLRPWAGLGCDVVETPSGLSVGAVRPDSFAGRAGLQRDDLLLTVSGSPVLTIRDLAVLMRAIPAGSPMEVRTLRGSRVEEHLAAL